MWWSKRKILSPPDSISTKTIMLRVSIKLEINPNIFLRDPQETELGQRIVQHGILMIDELGFESFTFKKLAEGIGSTEASVYRYFENKHALLVYLVNWYWEWMKFRISFHTMNVSDPIKRLKTTLRVIVDTSLKDASVNYVDTDVLHRIVVTEGTKAYHIKAVDKENKEGFFLAYKSLCGKISELILAVEPDFEYPRTLASSLVEMANNNIYFSEHLPRLTDITFNDNYLDDVYEMLVRFTFGLIGVEEE